MNCAAFEKERAKEFVVSIFSKIYTKVNIYI